MKYCPYCGADLNGGTDSFCTECGKPIKGRKTKARSVKKPPAEKRKRDMLEIHEDMYTESEAVEEPFHLEDEGYDGYYDDIKPTWLFFGYFILTVSCKLYITNIIIVFVFYFVFYSSVCHFVFTMKEMYLTLPEPLKKQIIAHLTMSFTALCFFFMIIVFCREFILAAPCLIFGVFVAIKSIHLFLNCISGNYLEINGICSKVEITGFRKRIKSISVAAENKTLKIPAQFLIKKPQKGNQVTLYLSKKAKLYYSEGSYIANDIYALHIH